MSNSFRLSKNSLQQYRCRVVQCLLTLILLLYLCPVLVGGEQIPSKYSSTVTITIKVFTTYDLSGVKNYAAALYDSSGIYVDSLVAQDTNLVSFLNVPITGVRSSREVPAGYFLGQNYPNPFNPSSRIKFTVPRAGPVSFKTYSILGQEDASLEMNLEPGSYEVQYSPGGAAGILFYRLITKDFSETKKMIQFGGQKSGKSHLALVSSGVQPRPQQLYTTAEHQSNNFTVKLHNLPLTSLPINDTIIHISGLMGDTTVTVYMAEAKGMPCPGTATVTYAGRIYNTVLIGTQCWLRENLNVGSRINGTQNQTDNLTIEKYCYTNDTNNCNTYGALYQWNEAMQYSTTQGTQGICPSGWHIPTRVEFQSLSTAVSGDGNALKAIGEGTGAGTGTNTSGFYGLLAGDRGTNGSFYGLGGTARVWNSTESWSANSYFLSLYDNSSSINLSDASKNFGFSVRCIRN